MDSTTKSAIVWKEPLIYSHSFYKSLKVKFKRSSTIKRNFSQCYQDMFVLAMLDGKKFGQFLEIGCGSPFYCNNTALLEKLFGWEGISVDINKEMTENFSKFRSSVVINSDAATLNYNKLLRKKDYDYLQIDCDPAAISYKVLEKIPFKSHKFAVITFEHDYYADPKSGVREKSREYLDSLGYELVVNNIAPDEYCSFEDWWVHPDLVREELILKMRCLSDMPKKADDYMFGKCRAKTTT
jgi:SAM-dependent methyltransferase